MQEIRLQRQKEASESWAVNNYRGTIAAGTGWGKTRCAVVDCYNKVRSSCSYLLSTLIVTIRESHRDVEWPTEMKEFESAILTDNNYKIICWASLTKEDLSNYDLIIIDEGHHITEDTYRHLSPFSGHILMLTATPPHEDSKAEWIQELAPICYVYGLEKGVEESINAPYFVKVIKIGPNNTLRDIKGGTKAKPFMTTEAAQLKYLDGRIKAEMIKRGGRGIDFGKDWASARYIRQRTDAIYGSETKRRAIIHILKTLYKKDKRFLVFGGSIPQVEAISNGNFTFHSQNKKLGRLQQFRDGLINLLLTVGMVDEGSNLPNLDVGIMGQVTSSSRRMVQRIGRMVRYRPGHIGHIYLLCLRGTQDEEWVNSALNSLPSYRFDICCYDDIYQFQNSPPEWIIK